MAERTLIAIVREDEEERGTLIACSPVVGIADGAPRTGLFINPLDKVLTIRVLNRRFVLRMPRDAQGRVTEVFIPIGCSPLSYGDPIARIDPRAHEERWGGGEAAAAGQPGAAGEEAAAGLITVTSPSEGIFYRRSSPDSPPYVEVGSEVSTGTVLGMVEVMKCFNQIVYGGPGLPPKGEVTRIPAEDAAEVRFGQALFLVKPLD